MPRPPISALIDAPRQSKLPLTCTILCRDHPHRATPNSHPNCRALLIKIVALPPMAKYVSGNVRRVEIWALQYFGDITIDRVTEAMLPDRKRPGRRNCGL